MLSQHNHHCTRIYFTQHLRVLPTDIANTHHFPYRDLPFGRNSSPVQIYLAVVPRRGNLPTVPLTNQSLTILRMSIPIGYCLPVRPRNSKLPKLAVRLLELSRKTELYSDFRPFHRSNLTSLFGDS